MVINIKKTIERDRERQTDIHTDREQRDRNGEHNLFLKNILFYKIHVLDSPKIICT